ncbi:MAG TPA: phenylalanine--tRNA ligase subunit beta [Syntrophorhabdaceae bacterium]|nr:phenylalanine--tRNA ligase subunit beta [Syntrophorhabdaceae bacterium]
MKVPLEWLREFVVIDIEPYELADKLTMRGLEIESIEKISPQFKGVVVGRIKQIERVTELDNISLCIIDTGNKDVSVLCGAKNIKKGDKVPIALPGAELPGMPVIEEKTIKGYNSVGMLCSERELGLSDDHSGIFILPDDFTVGKELREEPGLDDIVLDINVTPNRGDCLSIFGIAREVASILNQKAKIPIFELPKDRKGKIEDFISLKVFDLEACPRYVLRMIENVDIVPSPYWMRRRIQRCGMRPINSIVDVTNYVMLELGQPLHAFDYERLKQRRIEVKLAERPITFCTLDGEDRALEKGDLLICDGERPVAIAGIMGGENSEITNATRIIALESAYFNPLFIRRTARRLGLKSEASLRFEKGIDLENVDFSAQRAIALMHEIAGGVVIDGSLEINDAKKREGIFVSFGKINEVLGTNIDHSTILNALRSIDLHIVREEEKGFVVSVPWFRHDINEYMDIVEEVARIYGYDNIPVTTPRSPVVQFRKNKKNKIVSKVKEFLVSSGFFEVINFAFLSVKDIENFFISDGDERFSYVQILNPISKEYGIMRTFMAPNVIKNIAYNINRGIKNAKLFEIGKVFHPIKNEKLPREDIHLFLALTGKERDYYWKEQYKNFDFFDIKGVVEGIGERFGLNFVFQKTKEPFLEEKYSSDVFLEDVKIGWIGEIKKDVLTLYEIEQKVYGGEVNLMPFIEKAILDFKYKSIPRYPQVVRDFSFFVDESIPASTVIDKIKEMSPLIISVDIFDMFRKEKRSISFRVVFQSFEETLRDETVNEIQEKIIKEITKIDGISLRV